LNDRFKLLFHLKNIHLFTARVANQYQLPYLHFPNVGSFVRGKPEALGVFDKLKEPFLVSSQIALTFKVMVASLKKAIERPKF